MSLKIESNYPSWNYEQLQSQARLITYRTAPAQGDDPISWQQLDNNFEVLRYTVNSVIDEVALLGSNYYTKSESDAKYALSTDITPHVDAYTKSESDAKYALASDITPHVDSYTKTESDAKYQLAGNYQPAGDYALSTDITPHVDAYTKTESDGRYQPLGNYQPAGDYALASDITPHVDAYTKLESDARYALIGSTAAEEIVTLEQTIAELQTGSSVTISENATFNFASNAETLISQVSEDRMIFDYSRGALRVYDFNPSIPSVSSDDRHTLQLQRHTDRGAFGSASEPVGVSGQVNSALLAKSIVGPNVKSNEWAILGVVENYPNKDNSFAHAESEHCGGYFQGKRHGSGGKTWGATIEAWDLADTYDDVQHGSCVTVELDMTANFDAGANRVMVDGVLRKTYEELDRPGIIAGMRLRDNHENGSGGFFYNGYEFKGAVKYSAFSAEIVGDNSDDGVNPWGNAAFRALGTTYSHFQSQGSPTFSFRDVSNAAVGIGLDEANYSNCAIRLGVNQRVVMDSTGGVSFKYNGTSISFEGAPVQTTYMRPSSDTSNPLEVFVDNGWKKVEVGPADSGGAGYRALRVLN